MQLRRYGVLLAAGVAGSGLIRVSLRKAGLGTYATSADWTPAAGDVLVSQDGGAEANIASLPAYANGSWAIVLSAAELTARIVRIRISDAALDDWDETVETFGDAGATYPDTYSNQLLPAALVTGKMDSIAVVATDGISAGSLSPTAVGEIQAGLATSAEVGDVPTAAENAAALLSTAMPGAPAAGTVGEAFRAAAAQGMGDWDIAGDVLTLKDLAGATLAQFTLTPAGGPYVARVKQ